MELFNDPATVSNGSEIPRSSMETILLQFQMVATFPGFIMMIILLQSYMVVTFPDFIFQTFGMVLAYDLMMMCDYKLRFYPKFMNAISYGRKSFPKFMVFCYKLIVMILSR